LTEVQKTLGFGSLSETELSHVFDNAHDLPRGGVSTDEHRPSKRIVVRKLQLRERGVQNDAPECRPALKSVLTHLR
jgi:hypothetical protein